MTKSSPYKPLGSRIDKTVLLKTKAKESLGDPNEIELILYKDGSIAFSHNHAEQFTYLYKDQQKELLEILKEWRRKVQK